MTYRGIGKAFRLAAVAGVLSIIGLTASQPVLAGGGVSTGAAVGIGLGAFALGTVAGAGAAPYYGAPYPGYYAPPPPAYYYPPAPAYYAPRSCWNPYYGRYYPC